jgi:hypothetical protein
MSEGYCTNKEPVSGSVRRLNGARLGGKFLKLHGRRVGDCMCGRTIAVTDAGNLMRHKPPQP